MGRSSLWCAPCYFWGLHFCHVPAMKAKVVLSCFPPVVQVIPLGGPTGHTVLPSLLCSWITFKKNKKYLEVTRDGVSSGLLWLHVWGPRRGECPGTQVPQLHKKLYCKCHFWASAYVSSSWGKVAVFHQSTLSFHCVFDELCPGFCLEASNQQTFYCDYQGLMLLCSVQDLPVTTEHQQGNFYWAAWELWDCSLRKQPASWKNS